MTSNLGSTTSAKSGSGDPQFFINGIQKTTWKTNKYKLYCFKKSPLKQKGLQHKFQNHVHIMKLIQDCSVGVSTSNTTHNKRASTLLALRTKLPLRQGQCYINNNNNNNNNNKYIIHKQHIN